MSSPTLLPLGFALPGSETGLPLIEASAQSPTIAQRIQSAAGTLEQGPFSLPLGAANEAARALTSNPAAPFSLLSGSGLERLGTGLLGLLLVVGGLGIFGSRIVVENSKKVVKAAGAA